MTPELSTTGALGVSRVVVTGLGAVSPHGIGVEPLWSGLRAGEAPIRPIDLFDPERHRTRLAGQVDRELSLQLGREAANERRLTRSDRFALAAAREAVEQAQLTPELLEEAGVFFGSSTGGMFEGERVYFGVTGKSTDPERHLRFLQLGGQPVCGPADALARTFTTRGPVETIATACAAASMAIESALDSLRAGEVELALVGGSDGLCELTYGGFNSLRAVSPERTRPFRHEREGLSMGEGAGVLVLETEAHARARGARILAEVAGAGSSCDAHHMTAPHPEGAGARLAIERALADAGLAPAAIDFVNAHGTGTPHNDSAEWRALLAVFGERARELPLTSTKGSVGHLLGACGALEAVVTVLCLNASEVHPTPGHGEIDPDCPVDLVTEVPRALETCRAALSINLAFGGANAALVIRRAEDHSAEDCG